MSAVNVPDARALVTRAGNQELSVARKVERVNFLIMTRQEVLDAFLCNVPDLQGIIDNVICRRLWTCSDLTIFRPGCEEFAVWTETYAADVQIARLRRSLVDKDAAKDVSEKL